MSDETVGYAVLCHSSEAGETNIHVVKVFRTEEKAYGLLGELTAIAERFKIWGHNQLKFDYWVERQIGSLTAQQANTDYKAQMAAARATLQTFDPALQLDDEGWVDYEIQPVALGD